MTTEETISKMRMEVYKLKLLLDNPNEDSMSWWVLLGMRIRELRKLAEENERQIVNKD